MLSTPPRGNAVPIGYGVQAEPRQGLAPCCFMRWTPDFGRPDKVKPPGWEAPYQEDDDVGKATRVWGSV